MHVRKEPTWCGGWLGAHSADEARDGMRVVGAPGAGTFDVARPGTCGGRWQQVGVGDAPTGGGAACTACVCSWQQAFWCAGVGVEISTSKGSGGCKDASWMILLDGVDDGLG